MKILSKKLYLSLHSYGQLILLPWGYAREYPSDYNETLTLANLASSKFRAFNYRVGTTVDLLYRASGIDILNLQPLLSV